MVPRAWMLVIALLLVAASGVNAQDHSSVTNTNLWLNISILVFVILMCIGGTWYIFRRPWRKWWSGSAAYAATPDI